MSYKKIKIIILLTNALFLSGCSYFHRPPAFKTEPWKQRYTELRQIKDWTMNGSFSISYNKKMDIARFTWAQKQNRYDINISGPLNLNSIRIIGDLNNVELWGVGKKMIKASTPEQLVYEQFGWQLPISNIKYWILAAPVPGKIDAMSLDQYGHIVDLNQKGWQIKYSDFQADTQKKVDLPKTIELKNNEIAIKIKIKGSSLDMGH
ncbi:MAG: lipoprotein insertase outer membrane protein LolB [Gammaproteobacteria bacterium]|nr:lipoprotein insertase outer membrane protein LolB [Gammaproteobacteria bacterium]